MKSVKKVGVAAIDGNTRKFNALIMEMRATNRKFPINQYGNVNISRVAKKIGCTRDTIRNGTLSAPFKDALNQIGVERPKTEKKKINKEKTKSDREFKRSLEEKDQIINELETQTIELRRKLKKIIKIETEENNRFKLMIEEGIRFTL